MDEPPAKYKATESTLDAATKYLELFATIEDGDRYKFFLAESEARSKLLTDETPMPVRRMIDKFVRSAFASFIKNRELVESKSAQEYERIQKEHADEIALLKEAHSAELRRLTETHSSELERFKEERKRQEENVVRRRGVVARRHVAGFCCFLVSRHLRGLYDRRGV